MNIIYIQPLSEYKFNLKAKKLEGLARLVSLNLPTVSNLFIASPKLFQQYLKSKSLPTNANQELKTVFESIRKQGDTVTLRNSIYEKNNPAIAFCVHNSLNLKTFSHFQKRIILGYKKAKRIAIDPLQVEFSYLIQSFYSSEKCGTLLSDNGQGQIYLQAILGQHTNLLLRGDIDPDVYEISKKTYKIVSRNITQKKYRIRKLSSGIKKIRVKKTEQKQPVLKDEQVKRISKLSQILEKSYGPQEIEWAILDSGRIIFQETRDFKQSKNLKFYKKAEVIYPADTQGEAVHLKKLPVRDSLSEKIVITDNLNISFINKIAFLHRPKAVILTRGSLTSHAATILRESKVTTILVRDISFVDGENIKISKNGNIHKLS